MKSRDLYISMVGIDDTILAKAYRYSEGRKVVKFHKRLSVAACICLVLFASATAVAAIHHFWGRGMSGALKSTDVQQQTLTEQGQAIVYPELKDYSSYQVTDQGVTISPDTVVVDDKFAYVSFKVSGLNVSEKEEPGAEVDYYLGDDKGSESSWVSGSSSFYDGIVIDDNGMGVYEDGSPLEQDGFIGHYLDENGDLEYVIQIQAVEGLNSILGNTLHVDFTSLGVFKAAASYDERVKGNWNFALDLPTVSNSQTIKVNKDVPNSNCTITTIDISPVSITVNYKVNGELEASEDCLGIPQFTGFVMKDGTRMPYVANGGSDGFTDESKEYAVCSRCFDRVVDIEEVKSLIMWPDDEGGKDKVEVEIQ
jgi:hypothetical protein